MWTRTVAIVVPLVLAAIFVPLGSEANAAASIQSITPAQGPITGGTAVTLAGSGFTGTTVTLDGTAVTPSSVSDTQIVFQTPVHDNGIVTIKLSGNGPNAYAEFLYVPPRLQDLPPGYITTVAGIGQFTGLYRQATQAEIQPQGSPAFDRQGNMYIPEPGNNRITRVRPDGILEPFAGTGLADYGSLSDIGDGGPATEASLTFPRGVTTDAAGNAYITEFRHRIRKVDARTGVITTIAGNGTPGFSGDGGPALQARLHDVTHITGDGNGTFFFIDFDDASSVARIRKVTPDGIISTIAGIGPPGFSGDGGPATQAQLNLIYADRGSLALDSQGNLFIEDTGNDRIRRIDGRSGIITTVYGPASLGWGGVAADQSGNIFFWLDYRIIKMGPNGQILSTYGSATRSGSSQDDGTPIQNANVSSYGLVIDPSGNIVYVESHRARRLNLSTGVLETLAGMGSRIIGENGPAIATTLPSATDITFLPTGELLIGDFGHFLVRKIDRNGNVSPFANGGGSSFDRPLAIRSDGVGNVFVVDPWSVYRIDSTGTVRLFAGRRQPCGYTGDGGPATEAFLCQPWDAALDGAGNLYIADTNNNRIRRVDARTGIITTVAGSGPVNGLEHYGSDGQGSFSGDGGPATRATLNTPYGVAVDSQGNLFIGDGDNRRIRRVDPNGIITTFAAITSSGVTKLAIDGAGNLYSAVDTGLFRYDPSGKRTQLAGQWPPGFSGDGGPALQAKTRSGAQSVGVAVDVEGNVFFVDAGNQRIRAVRYGAVIAEPGSTVNVRSGSSQTTAAGTIFPTVFQISLRSPAGTPANGIRVDFTAPASGASCTFVGGKSTFSTLTDISGNAIATCTANSQFGSYSVTATPLALGQSATFSLTNTNTAPIASALTAVAVAGDAQATVTVTPRTAGGTGTVYTTTSSPDAITVTGTASPITITGLTNGKSYTFTVTAVDVTSGSVSSAVSNIVIPASATLANTVVDIRNYIPAALSSAGYMGFIRVINPSGTATPVSVAVIDENTGVAGGAKTLTGALPAGAAVTYSAVDIEQALGGAIAAGSRPRIRVSAPVPIQAQSFQANPGGISTLNSSALSETSVDVPSYLPWALHTSNYVSYLRIINTGTSATAVSVALIDGDTGVVGTAGTLNAALPPGAAVTYSGQQIESALGINLPGSARPRIRVTSTTAVEVQSFQANPGGVVTDNGYVQFQGTTTGDVRNYIPAALNSAGYMGFIRVINTSSAATPITVAVIDENTGAIGNTRTLAASLPAGAAVTYAATDIEQALGGAIPAGSRPRIRVSAQVPIQAQSFQSNPGGVVTLNSSALTGTSVDMPSYLPWALHWSGFVSYLRIINTGTNATAVSAALIDGDTGVVGTAGTLNAALPPGAAVTYSGQQIEAALGASPPASARPRIRVTSTTAVEVQSFQANPGGVVTDVAYVQ